MIDVIKYILAAGAGAGVGYFIAYKKMERTYFELLTKETEEARDFYRKKYEKQSNVASAAEALLTYQGAPLVESPQDQDVVPEETVKAVEPEKLRKSSTYGLNKTPEPVAYHKVSQKKDEEPAQTKTDAEDNGTQKDTGIPLPEIIELKDFVESETGYKQFSITYFAGDDTLASESDTVIDLEARNISVGEEVLSKLKAGPKAMNDQDAIYVRNHTQTVELEIMWREGKYSEEVQISEETG